jgi:hypothetical protein
MKLAVYQIDEKGIYEDGKLVYMWLNYDEYFDYMEENNLWNEDNEDDEE